MGSAPDIIGATRTITPDPLTAFLYGGGFNYVFAAFGIFMILYAIKVFVINKYLHPVDELAVIEQGCDPEDDET
jgi:hypothetical protein